MHGAVRDELLGAHGSHVNVRLADFLVRYSSDSTLWIAAPEGLLSFNEDGQFIKTICEKGIIDLAFRSIEAYILSRHSRAADKPADTVSVVSVVNGKLLREFDVPKV